MNNVYRPSSFTDENLVVEPGEVMDYVTSHLIVSNGASTWSLEPSNPGGTLRLLPNPDRGRQNERFYFWLPKSLTYGATTLHFEIESLGCQAFDPNAPDFDIDQSYPCDFPTTLYFYDAPTPALYWSLPKA